MASEPMPAARKKVLNELAEERRKAAKKIGKAKDTKGRHKEVREWDKTRRRVLDKMP